MNIAYFRKSTFGREKTVGNVNKYAELLGLTIVGVTDLSGGKGSVIHVVDPRLTGNLVAADANLIGLLPSQILVHERDGHTAIGVGSPSILGSVSGSPAVTDIAATLEKKLKELVEKSAGVGPRKATGVKLYSTMTCPYCKQEAAWLDGNKVSYEEVHVDLNQKEAQHMVDKTGQMGVPVTEIRYGDGEEEYIIGFDRGKLSQVLGIS